MKKLLAVLLVLLILTGCATQSCKTDDDYVKEGWVKDPATNGYVEVPKLPDAIDTTKSYKDKDGKEIACDAKSYAAGCSSVTADNFLDFDGRDDVMYIDLRDYNDFAKKHIRNFEVIPYFALVFNAEAGKDGNPQLFGGTVAEPVATYKESVELLEVFFPKDKTIFLMCQSGGRVAQLMTLLEANGWDMSKIYNIGGMAQYTDAKYNDYIVDSAEVIIEANYSFDGLTPNN